MFALTTSPSSTLLTAGQVAAILKLHVRTIRGYVRSGTLKATRVGKQVPGSRAERPRNIHGTAGRKP